MTLIQQTPKKIYIRVDQQWWQPWANTVAYYPLASQNTLKDESGNWYDLTNSGTILYDTYNWVSCVKFNQTWSMNVSNVNKLPSWNSAFTVSYWIYPNSLSESSWESNAFFIGTSSNQRWWLVYALSPIGISVWGTAFQSTTNATLSTWQNIIVTQNWNLFNLYLNWNFLKSWTMALNMSTKTIRLGGSLNPNTYWYRWGMSNFIIEDKERTAQEITDYYNLTKWNYWL